MAGFFEHFENRVLTSKTQFKKLHLEIVEKAKQFHQRNVYERHGLLLLLRRMKKESLGNSHLLNLPKTAFLCSRKVPASAVLRCYDSLNQDFHKMMKMNKIKKNQVNLSNLIKMMVRAKVHSNNE